jgi:hypothetical protein
MNLHFVVVASKKTKAPLKVYEVPLDFRGAEFQGPGGSRDSTELDVVAEFFHEERHHSEFSDASIGAFLALYRLIKAAKPGSGTLIERMLATAFRAGIEYGQSVTKDESDK